jgi:hypothetical protein
VSGRALSMTDTRVIIGEASDYDGAIAAIRARVHHLGLSHVLIDELANLASGYTGKLLGESQVKQMSWRSFLAITETLGIATVFVVDPKLVAQMEPHWERGASEKRRTLRKAPLGKVTIERVFPVIAREMQKRSSEVRTSQLTPAQRIAIARKAGKASGRARLRRGMIGFAESKPSAKRSYRRPRSGWGESFCPNHTG